MIAIAIMIMIIIMIINIPKRNSARPPRPVDRASSRPPLRHRAKRPPRKDGVLATG